jgi:hypothetical protein
LVNLAPTAADAGVGDLLKHKVWAWFAGWLSRRDPRECEGAQVERKGGPTSTAEIETEAEINIEAITAIARIRQKCGRECYLRARLQLGTRGAAKHSNAVQRRPGPPGVGGGSEPGRQSPPPCDPDSEPSLASSRVCAGVPPGRASSCMRLQRRLGFAFLCAAATKP